MARTKRKVNPIFPTETQSAPQQRIYKAGGYVRLSVEDSGKPDADTLEAQKELVLGYIEAQPGMEICGLYCDNGRTGTNFRRPEFERLMNDVRAGKIDCIVVKDLSRFGRNYKETGQYLEQIFPFLGVRFVAIHDSFDTLTAGRSSNGYIVPLKNIMNEVYSRDISRKVRSALSAKQKNGEFIGSWAPYGYRKCAGDKHRLEPDPETAPMVQKIFRLRAAGVSFHTIAKQLNDGGVPTPAQYRHQIGEIKSDRYANARWNIFTLKSIVESEVYIGNLVQGRKTSGLCQGQKQRRTQKEEWVIVEGTHEPLVDVGTFQAVQAIKQKAREAHKKNLGKDDHLDPTPNILRGLVFCADCGKPLKRFRQVAQGTHFYYAYVCPTHRMDSTACPGKYLHETQLKEVLWEALQREIALAGDMAGLAKKYDRSAGALACAGALEKEITVAKRRLARCKMLYDRLYQSYVDKLFDEREYMEMRARYRADVEREQARLDKLERQRQQGCQKTAENPWLDYFSRFTGETELTEGMARALIERIEADSRENLTIYLRYRDEYADLARLLGVAV